MIDGLTIDFSDVNGWAVLLTVALVAGLALFLRFATEAQSQRIVVAATKSAVASAVTLSTRLSLVEGRMTEFERDYRLTRERVRVLETRVSVFSPHG